MLAALLQARAVQAVPLLKTSILKTASSVRSLGLKIYFVEETRCTCCFCFRGGSLQPKWLRFVQQQCGVLSENRGPGPVLNWGPSEQRGGISGVLPGAPRTDGIAHWSRVCTRSRPTRSHAAAIPVLRQMSGFARACVRVTPVFLRRKSSTAGDSGVPSHGELPSRER